MLPFRFHQFLHESEGTEKHPCTLLRQWLTMVNILIKLHWVRFPHGLCNCAGVFCATPGRVNLSNSPQSTGLCSGDATGGCSGLWRWEIDFPSVHGPLSLWGSSLCSFGTGLSWGRWRSCSSAIHRSESWSWSRISCYWAQGTALDTPHAQAVNLSYEYITQNLGLVF